VVIDEGTIVVSRGDGWTSLRPQGEAEQDMMSGQARATIANEIVRLQSEYYGKGPTKSRVRVDADVVVVILEETFTPAERTLIERGEADGIQDIRRRFQRAMAEQFISIVEQATGRQVRSFFSDTDLKNDISVEVFVLADARTDMSGFEPAEKADPAEDD
jgi:uncharacterized protein YbcI